ncbi:MAG: hypothetical protein HDT30_06275 [Clostridiales bacterium]|nr:hypothetical protein [Clostridiales bacterium]
MIEKKIKRVDSGIWRSCLIELQWTRVTEWGFAKCHIRESGFIRRTRENGKFIIEKH